MCALLVKKIDMEMSKVTEATSLSQSSLTTALHTSLERMGQKVRTWRAMSLPL